MKHTKNAKIWGSGENANEIKCNQIGFSATCSAAKMIKLRFKSDTRPTQRLLKDYAISHVPKL